MLTPSFLIGMSAKIDFGASKLATDPLSMSSVAATLPPSEETLESIGSEIEKSLQSESGSIMEGFREIESRMDQDFAKSGMKTLHEIEESLRQHSQSLQQQFKAMTEQMRKGMDRMTGMMQSSASDETSRDMMTAAAAAVESGTNGTTGIFSSQFWRSVFS